MKENVRTTHCVPYGNPVTTAGPNARAVFTAPPVKYIDQLEEGISRGQGRNNLIFHISQTKRVSPIPTFDVPWKRALVAK